jgi:ubiquinone/menaquinone biosynthesis C-methylase UbiE
MAISWKQAQENERKFWEDIYVEKREDIPTYRPITDQMALAFAEKSLHRFGQNLETVSGKTIADIGCGPYGIIKGIDVYGQMTTLYPTKILGVDPLMETYLKFDTLPKRAYIELVASKGESIPLKDNVCDLVYSINVIDHVENPNLFIKECHRICKLGGGFMVSAHVVRGPFTMLRPLFFLFDKNHPHHFTVRKLCQLADKYFQNVSITTVVTVLEDQKDFTFKNIFTSKDKVRAAKRWLSTFVLATIYIQCSK